MFTARRHIFEQHVSKLMDIALYVDSHIDTTGRDNYQKRASGFLVERANSYLCYKALLNGIKIAQAEVEEHKDWKPEDAPDKRGVHSEG